MAVRSRRKSLHFESLEERRVLAAIAVDDSYEVDPGETLAAVAGPYNARLTLSINARYAIYDPVSDKIYASLGSDQPNGNSIVAIDPYTGVAGTPLFVGSEPTRLSVSSDGAYLYVGLNGANAVRRVHLPTFTAGQQFSLGNLGAEDIDAVPGQPESVAVSLYQPGLSPRTAGIAIYDNGVQRPQLAGGNNLDFNEDGSLAYSFLPETSDKDVNSMSVVAEGFVGIQTEKNLINSGGEITYEGGRLFFEAGYVLDASDMTPLGTYSGRGYLAADADANRVFFLDGDEIDVYNMETFLPLGSIPFPGAPDTTFRLFRFGVDGLAFQATDGKLRLVRSDEISGAATVAGVKSNDSDPTGDAIAALYDDVDHGVLTFGAGGGFTYTPDAGFTGVDSFAYRLTAGDGDSNIATVSSQVGPLGAGPTAVPDWYTTLAHTPLRVAAAEGVLRNDLQASGAGVTATVLDGPDEGQLSLAADGSFVYAPRLGFSGRDTFSYTVDDGAGGDDTVVVSIDVVEFYPFYNPDLPFDNDGDGLVTNGDVMRPIDFLRDTGGGGPLASLGLDPNILCDANRDNWLSVIDVLLIRSYQRNNTLRGAKVESSSQQASEQTSASFVEPRSEVGDRRSESEAVAASAASAAAADDADVDDDDDDETKKRRRR